MTTLIGSGPDQIPTNSMLGGMAFQDPDYVHVGSVVVDNTFSVGTSSPSYKVHINGVGSTIVGVEGTTDASFITRVNGVQALYLHSTASTSEVNELRNVPLNVSVNGATRFTMNPDGNSFFTGTGALKIHEGTTAQRPSSPSAGMLRMNSTTGLIEGYSGGAWRQLQGGLIAIKYYTTPGIGTYTPSPGTRFIVVEGCSGGGAGGGVLPDATGKGAVGAGGGAGAYFRVTIADPEYFPEGSTMQVGAGGTGVIGIGGSGGATAILNGLIVVNGGDGGQGDTVGNSGSISIGRIPGAGALNTTISSPAAGFSSCGSQGGWGMMQSAAVGRSGEGGDSYFGGGGASKLLFSVGGNIATIGTDAQSYGSGGGGAVGYWASSSYSGARGGNGAPGIIIVYEYA